MLDAPTEYPATPTAAYRNPNELIALGHRQIQTLTRRFFRQATQPKWLKISASLYDDGKWHLHSSQIGGFANGSLKIPSPKALMVLGQLNRSLAASLTGPDGQRLFPDVTAPTLPGELRHLWGHLTPMLDGDGAPFGPVEIFLIVSGQMDLGLDTDREIPRESEEAVCKAMARYLRLAFGRLGIDFLEDMAKLRLICPSMEPLLMGKIIPGDVLVGDLPSLAQAISETDGDLWAVCQDAAA
jgi:hypothetical protein